jgi:hypothetical protein
MQTMKKKYLILMVLVAFFASCTDKFEEFNTDVKSPTVVPGESLFTYAQKQLSDQVSSTDVNLNVWKLFSQYWTETTYTNEATYDIINRTIPDNTFRQYYNGFLKDFKEAAAIIEAKTPTGSVGDGEKEKANKLAIIDLLTVYSYQQLVDIFGNIPYSEASDIKRIAPVYDDAFTVYTDLLSRVNADLAKLDVSAGSFGSADLFYAGSVSKWIKFGNSLKVKLAVNLADYDENLSKTTMEAAAPLAFTSNSDNALLLYGSSSPNTNPLYKDLVLSGRDDFIPANTVVDIMNSLDDPRRDMYFANPIDTSSEAGVEKLAYVGGTYGVPGDIADYSHIADRIQQATFPGILLTYDEILFYLAEGAARGFNVGATPEKLYNDAITASFDFWNVSEDIAATYLAKPAVAYSTAAGTWKQKIGTQEWIAFYSRGLEGYTSWRRLDFPILNHPPLTTYGNIPKRFTYPVNEQTLNKDNYTKASLAIGGDLLTTRLFWDKF